MDNLKASKVFYYFVTFFYSLGLMFFIAEGIKGNVRPKLFLFFIAVSLGLYWMEQINNQIKKRIKENQKKKYEAQQEETN